MMEKGDSESQGEHERKIGSEKDEHQLATLPDPDAGLSEEERAKIVSSLRYCLMACH
jgi:hypothetical protein